MAGPFLSRDFTHYVQLEATFNTSPGALAGSDAFKCRTEYPFERVKARLDRDRDSGASASVITTQGGRESSTWEIEADLIPSDNSTTPTEPDMDAFFEAHFGTKHKATAHTTTGVGSAGTSLVLTGGGGAATGLQAGDLFAVDVSTAVGYEIRRVVSIATDTVTIDRAFTTDPASGRTVKVGTTYRFSVSALKSVHLWEFLSGNNFRHKAGGCIPRQMVVGVDFTEDTPVGTVTFSGDGHIIAEQTATSEPTAVTAGLPLVPTKSYAWFGTTKLCISNLELTSDNGNELRNNTSCDLTPTGIKKTGNNGRYNVTLDLSVLLETGTIEGFYDNADALTSYSVQIQLGVAAGSMVGINLPKFIPDTPVETIDGEVALSMSGRCYATTGDDEAYFAFI